MMKRRFHKKRVDGRKEMKKLALLHGVGQPDKNFDVSGHVPQAFIPSDGYTTCHNCKHERQMITIHCEHCDAALQGFEGVPRTPSDDVAKHGPDCFCEDCVSAASDLQNESEGKEMADFGDSAPQKSGKGGGKSNSSFADFFKGSDLPAKGNVTAKITGFREESLEYSQYQLDFKIGNKDWTLGLRDESDGRLRALVKVLGGKTQRWIGKSFKMTRHAKADRSGNPRIQILPN